MERGYALPCIALNRLVNLHRAFLNILSKVLLTTFESRENSVSVSNKEAQGMDKQELAGKALDLLHQLYDEHEQDMEEADLEELDHILDRLENLRQAWFDEEAE